MNRKYSAVPSHSSDVQDLNSNLSFPVSPVSGELNIAI